MLRVIRTSPERYVCHFHIRQHAPHLLHEEGHLMTWARPDTIAQASPILGAGRWGHGGGTASASILRTQTPCPRCWPGPGARYAAAGACVTARRAECCRGRRSQSARAGGTKCLRHDVMALRRYHMRIIAAGTHPARRQSSARRTTGHWPAGVRAEQGEPDRTRG